VYYETKAEYGFVVFVNLDIKAQTEIDISAA
jgi:hypothetical protein